MSNLSKSFASKDGSPVTQVLHGLSLEVRAGEFVTLFGPNGCGKTTLLKSIAGVLAVDEGTIRIDDRSHRDTRIGYILQNYDESLFPWASAWENIAFPLRLRGMPRHDRRARVLALLSELDIGVPLELYPWQLSGGQKQLCAIARALMFDPDLLVMDEPFSALDHEARLSMQSKLQELWAKRRLTILFVSHEIDEAIFLADRLVLLTKRPARLRSVFHITLPRPRKHSMLETEAFFGIRSSVLHEFMEVMAE